MCRTTKCLIWSAVPVNGLGKALAGGGGCSCCSLLHNTLMTDSFNDHLDTQTTLSHEDLVASLVMTSLENMENVPLASIDSPPRGQDALMVLLPLLIVLSTFLFLLLLFLVCIILVRRRRGIVLRDRDGPVDLSREDVIEGEGGFDGMESRWLESVSENARGLYQRAKGMQHHLTRNFWFYLSF
jgi:hypothetical protein